MESAAIKIQATYRGALLRRDLKIRSLQHAKRSKVSQFDPYDIEDSAIIEGLAARRLSIRKPMPLFEADITY